jgi:hypothetical protein
MPDIKHSNNIMNGEKIMHKSSKSFLILVLILALCHSCYQSKPLQLHPENQHYFLYMGKPTILIGSTEHYGALLNLDFDYTTYFKALHKDGLNLTRTFTGVYCEHPEAFNITKNTLAPDSGKLICPWARSEEAGYFNGGNKFDLSKWDMAYFKRLKDFIELAAKHDIMVELVLFCTYYGDAQWNLSPLNIKNNINSIGEIGRTDVLALKDDHLTEVQAAMVRKIVTELNNYDNLFYEICNEPYFAGVTDEWQEYISGIIKNTESSLSKQHLIAQNIANNSKKIENPDQNISIFNFHYAISDAVDENYDLNKVIGDDETGFDGTEDDPYRIEGWNFLISGGGLYDHLDYSFAVGYENGTFRYPPSQPGGGGISLRNQFKIMKSFLYGFDFIQMNPMHEILSGRIPPQISARVLGNSATAYACYFYKKSQTDVNYSLRWTGQIIPEFSEPYTFYTLADDGVRLWIDGELLIDDWKTHAPEEHQGKINLKAGEAVDIRLEFFQGMGGATASLSWSSPRLKKQIIPGLAFRLPDKNKRGLQIELFNDVSLQAFRDYRVVDLIEFNGTLSTIFKKSEQSNALKPEFDLPAGTYHYQWINTKTGNVDEDGLFTHDGGKRELSAPIFDVDIALKIFVE